MHFNSKQDNKAEIIWGDTWKCSSGIAVKNNIVIFVMILPSSIVYHELKKGPGLILSPVGPRAWYGCLLGSIKVLCYWWQQKKAPERSIQSDRIWSLWKVPRETGPASKSVEEDIMITNVRGSIEIWGQENQRTYQTVFLGSFTPPRLI